MTLEKGKTYATEVAINDKLVSVELECLGERVKKLSLASSMYELAQLGG